MTLRVLSLGAGVQSSTLLLMAVRAEIERPDCAIFADTQWEPREVYSWLDFIESEVGGLFPIHRVSIGDIRANCLNKSKRNAQPPFYVKSNGSDRETMIRRQCTKGYKIEPIQKKVRELLGLKPRQRAPKFVAVEQWMGISSVGIRGINGEPFLHRSLKPLDEVDLSTLEDHGQMNFLNECEGMCGV